MKGMKWGVRKDKKKGGRSADATAAAKLKGRSVSTLSNQELKTLATRQRLETGYKKSNPKAGEQAAKKGKDLVGKVLSQFGNVTVGVVVGAAGAKAGEVIVKKAAATKAAVELAKKLKI